MTLLGIDSGMSSACVRACVCGCVCDTCSSSSHTNNINFKNRDSVIHTTIVYTKFISHHRIKAICPNVS